MLGMAISRAVEGSARFDAVVSSIGVRPGVVLDLRGGWNVIEDLPHARAQGVGAGKGDLPADWKGLSRSCEDVPTVSSASGGEQIL